MKAFSLPCGHPIRPPCDLAIAAAVFLTITVPGVFSEGYGTDDWMQIGGPDDEWLFHYGRWATHGLSLLMNGHFLPGLQLAVAFLALFATARILARHAVAEPMRGTAAVLIFVLGLNHFYMTETLSFASHLMGYPLAIAASVAGFDLLYQALDRPRPAAIRAICAAAALLALALGLYQTFALAGGLIPALVLLRHDRDDLRRVGRYLGLCLVGAGLALGLHLAARVLYQDLTGIATPAGYDLRVSYFPHPLQTLMGLPEVLADLHSSNIDQGFPAALRWINRGFFVLVLAYAGFAWLARPVARSGESPLGSALRLVSATVAVLAILPVLFLFFVDVYLAGRAFGYLGLAYGALVAGCAGLLSRPGGHPGPAAWVGLGLLAAMAVFQTAITAAVWDDRARIAARDEALAGAVIARLSALPGYRGDAFRVFGGRVYRDLNWGGALGLSVFGGARGDLSIFRELYATGWLPAPAVAPPRPCPAFPADGAVFLQGGVAWVCLEAKTGP